MSTDLLQIARHEAAHAVIAFVLGLRFRADGVSIEQRRIGGVLSGGHVSLRSPSRREDFLRSSLAGPIYDAETQRDELNFEKAERLIIGMVSDARNCASILADLWDCEERSPLGRATQLRNWSPLSDSLGDTVFLRVYKKKAQAACLFLDSFRLAVGLCNLPSADAEQAFGRLAQQGPPLNAIVRSHDNYDPRVFPFLHRLAHETWRLLATHRDTIEALAECLMQKQALSGPDLESFLTAHQTTGQK